MTMKNSRCSFSDTHQTQSPSCARKGQRKYREGSAEENTHWCKNPRRSSKSCLLELVFLWKPKFLKVFDPAQNRENSKNPTFSKTSAILRPWHPRSSQELAQRVPEWVLLPTTSFNHFGLFVTPNTKFCHSRSLMQTAATNIHQQTFRNIHALR